MKHADKVIELMAAYPGREFRMIHIVRFINPRAGKQEKFAIRWCVREALRALEQSGVIEINQPKPLRGGYATYIWKSAR